MTNLKTRSLFAAVLVARAICGLDAARAATYAVTGSIVGGGNVVLGSGDASIDASLAGYLDPGGHNFVTLDSTAATLMTLPFSSVDPSGDIFGNTLLNQGTVQTDGLDGVVFSGDIVDGNNLTNVGSVLAMGAAGVGVHLEGNAVTSNRIANTHLISGNSAAGILIHGDYTSSGNSIVNTGAVYSYGSEAISLGGDGITSDNTIFNSSQLYSLASGVLLSGDSLTGNQVTNGTGAMITTNTAAGICLSALQDIAGNQVTNSGEIASTHGNGIELYAGGDITSRFATDASGVLVETWNTITNAGLINAPEGAGILLDGGTATRNRVGNMPAGSISGRQGIVVFGEGEASGNEVVNMGTITATGTGAATYDGAGVGLGIGSGNGPVEGNHVVNQLDITSSEIGIALFAGTNGMGPIPPVDPGAFSGSDLSGNVVVNALTGRISGGEVGIGLGAMHDVTGNTVLNVGQIASLDGTGIMLRASHDMADNSLVNHLQGQISAFDEGILLSVAGRLDTNTIDNFGQISSLGADGIKLSGDAGASLNRITNQSTGQISAHERGIYVESRLGPLAGNSVTNAGTIQSPDGRGIVFEGIGIGSATRLDPDTGQLVEVKTEIVNEVGATIATGFTGILLRSEAGITDGLVTNRGNIQTTTNGSGIYLSASHDIIGNQILNAEGAVLSAHGDGVSLHASNGLAGNSIKNYGTIGTDAPGSYGDAIVLYSNDGALAGNTVTNYAGGTITSRSDSIVLYTDSDLTDNFVTNYGNISTRDYDSGEGFDLDASGDVAGNRILNAAGARMQVDGDGVQISSSRNITRNTVTNAGRITSLSDGGIQMSARTGIMLNTVTNVAGGRILCADEGIRLRAEEIVADNTLTNAGEIRTTTGTGILLESYDAIRGNLVLNAAPASDVLPDYLIRDGMIRAMNGIQLQAARMIEVNEVTNDGAIIAGSIGIVLGMGVDSSGTTLAVDGNLVSNTGSIFIPANTIKKAYSDDGVGIEMCGDSVADNLVSNSGSIVVEDAGTAVRIHGNSSANDNFVENSGTIRVDVAIGMGALQPDRLQGTAGLQISGDSAAMVRGNHVTNDESGNIEVGEGGVGISLDNYLNDLPATRFAGQNGSISAVLPGIHDNLVANHGDIRADGQGAGIALLGRAPDRVLDKFTGTTALTGNLVENTGTIVVGTQGAGILLDNAYREVILDAASLGAVDAAGVRGNTVTNSGSITAGMQGVGIQITEGSLGLFTALADPANPNNTVTNTTTGIIRAADGGTGIAISRSHDNLVTNSGRIEAGNAGTGISITGNGNTVVNAGTGSITSDGIGVAISGTGNTLANWGRISAIQQNSTHAIQVTGSGNVVNLEGHSSVYGKITGLGVDPSGNPLNTLNLNFTGLTPEAIAALKADIAAKLAADPDQSEGITFTVRGVTYTFDPMTINTDGLLSYELTGGTKSLTALGATLDGLAQNPDPGSDLFNLLNAVDRSGNIPLALAALSPQRYQLFGDIAVSTMSSVGQQIDHRMAFLGGDMPEKRGNLWISGGCKDAKVDGDDRDVTDAKFSTNSVVVGADYRVNPAFTMGALFHYSATNDAELDNLGSKADVDSRGFGVYAGYRQGGFYGNALAVHSKNDYDTKRVVAIPGYTYTAKADTNGHQTGFGIDGGYDFRVNDQLAVGPLAGLQWVRLKVDGFEESGAPAANLAVGGQTMTSLLGRVGGRLAYSAPVGGNSTFSLDLHAAFQREFKNDSRDIKALFLGSGLDAFAVKTADPKRNSVLLGAGFNYDFHGAASIFANYDLQTGSSNWHEHNVKGGVRISF